MTPQQMLRLINKTVPTVTAAITTPIRPLRQLGIAPGVCKTCGFVANRHSTFCPQNPVTTLRTTPDSDVAAQVVIHATQAEPWMIEQFEELDCPTCGADLMCMHNVPNKVRFYTCESKPLQHRWAYYYTK